MFLRDFLIEKAVTSTWITDLTNQRNRRVVIMTLNNNRKYAIIGMSRYEFDKWHIAPSKGKYWHAFVKGFYDVQRIV